ncbi:hypothetical protein FVEG_16971 [Fusarium verticillioides 7600]|uniref:Uncharacterized protein n=1 Tax=Gibberella moniliformis (strain M3125 / FGSC 7600) TaxID=334819 RepID=W7MMS4_GIBM7|nr:hypothetical protein FVEG_16971 [Fusarium verticillioides 7600]EWG52366.1 hypothetical protein FVEG_16971 [Fusarium verticillioides 7600]
MCQGNSPENSFDPRHLVTGDDVGGTLLYQLGHMLLYLINNEYWELAWIIQELLLGGQGVVLIGQTEIPWDRLFQHTRLLCEPDNHLSSIKPEFFAQSPLATIARHRKEGSGFTPLNLPELLSQFGNVRSHDFHDRIYALLGLAKDRDRVTVDYGSTKEDFFFDI